MFESMRVVPPITWSHLDLYSGRRLAPSEEHKHYNRRDSGNSGQKDEELPEGLAIERFEQSRVRTRQKGQRPSQVTGREVLRR